MRPKIESSVSFEVLIKLMNRIIFTGIIQAMSNINTRERE
jgi:hypothetical protein